MKPNWRDRLKEILGRKYRFILINNETFEETKPQSFVVGRLIALVFVGLILLFALSLFFIRVTPLRYMVVPSSEMSDHEAKQKLVAKVQEMETKFKQQEEMIASMQKSTGFEAPEGAETNAGHPAAGSQTAAPAPPPPTPAASQPAQQSSGTPVVMVSGNNYSQSKWLRFINPVQGQLLRAYNSAQGHYAVDLAAAEMANVYAVSDGVVIMSEFSIENGFVIGIQHANNFVSFYKHNRTLFKKVGSNVKTGDVIALVGDSGENSTGPHLHFELWLNGKPVNPAEYLNY